MQKKAKSVARTRASQAQRERDEAKAIEAGGLYQLDDVDRAILKHDARYPGCSARAISEAIAKEIGRTIHHTSVHRRMQKPAYVKARSEIDMSCHDVLKRAATKAARKLETLLDSRDEDIAFKASKELLKPFLGADNAGPAFKPIVIFRTNITPDGNLIQEVIDAELGPDPNAPGALPANPEEVLKG